MNAMHKRFEKSIPGILFKEDTGKLYIFRDESISVLKSWPEPQAWQKTAQNPVWQTFRPDIKISRLKSSNRSILLEKRPSNINQLCLPFSPPAHKAQIDRRELAWLRWFATIPPETLRVVWSFPERQWHMLSFLARCGEAAYDLSISNPALAFTLASNWVFHQPAVKQPFRSARALLKPGIKQREILAWLGYPETEAARKMLSKVIHKAIGISPLLYLRQSMFDPTTFKTLTHLPRLNSGVLRLATDPVLLPMAAPTLLEEIATSRKEDNRINAAYLLKQSLLIHRSLHPTRTHIVPIRSLRYLIEYHHNILTEYLAAQYRKHNRSFPPPPLKGSEEIQPISSLDALIKEGYEQNNCAVTYLEAVTIFKSVYIYRVLWPERSTLALKRKGHRWVLWQLKLANNLDPSEKTYEVVHSWLEEETGVDCSLDFACEDEQVPF